MVSEPLDLPAEQCPVSQGHEDESSSDEDEASHSSGGDDTQGTTGLYCQSVSDGNFQTVCEKTSSFLRNFLIQKLKTTESNNVDGRSEMFMDQDVSEPRHRTSSSCRCLFPRLKSSEESQKEIDELLALRRQQAAARWGFDFKAGRPLPGPWNWEAVPSCSIPSFYHSRCISPPYVNGLLIVDN